MMKYEVGSPEQEEIDAISTEGLSSVEMMYLAQVLFTKGMDVLRDVLRASPNANKEAYVYNNLNAIFQGYGRSPSLPDWVEEEEEKFNLDHAEQGE